MLPETVHVLVAAVLEAGMNEDEASQYASVDSSDPEWVADLFDTMRAGARDLEGALTSLESVTESVRRAAKARRILAHVEPGLLSQGLRVSTLRRAGHP